ncbi:hypothetical protein ACFJGW_20675 [Burkholderiaceae bacterium UC74_6]
MTIQHAQTLPHWNYFLSLEDDIAHLARWIEFSKPNEAVYSIELARLLMAAAQEADVVAKALCRSLAPTARAETIGAYQAVLVGAIPEVPDALVEMPRHGMSFTPWSNWHRQRTPPDWWTGNNKVKHHRAEQFHHASLKNVLNAVAALLVLLLLLYGLSEHIINPMPRLFVPRAFGLYLEDGLVLSPPAAVAALR